MTLVSIFFLPCALGTSVNGRRDGKRREAPRTRWNAGLEGLENDCQSCCNASRKAPSALHGVLRHRGSVRAHKHRKGLGGVLQEGLLLKALDTTRLASKDAWLLLPPRPCWNLRMPRRRFHGRGQWCAAGSAGSSYEIGTRVPPFLGLLRCPLPQPCSHSACGPEKLLPGLHFQLLKICKWSKTLEKMLSGRSIFNE